MGIKDVINKLMSSSSKSTADEGDNSSSSASPIKQEDKDIKYWLES
ncbi:hypothetical protein AGMMS50233_05020 [Endomicrobiia bacterium]|nr:hypothetical protein AGMMS50233_05020 [Endomicrobiia bacterium]